MIKEEQYHWERLLLSPSFKEQNVPFNVKNSEQKVLFSSKLTLCSYFSQQFIPFVPSTPYSNNLSMMGKFPKQKREQRPKIK